MIALKAYTFNCVATACVWECEAGERVGSRMKGDINGKQTPPTAVHPFCHVRRTSLLEVLAVSTDYDTTF